MILFENTEVTVPTVISPGKSVDVKFKIIGDASQIKSMTPSCGCTANVRIEGDYVIATFTDTEAVRLTPQQIKAYYKNGVYHYAKSINVNLKDNQASIKLKFNGQIKFPSN